MKLLILFFLILFSSFIQSAEAKTVSCKPHNSGWVFPINDYVAVGNELRERTEPDPYHRCSNKLHKNKIIEDEISLYDRTDQPNLRVKDLCDQQPTLIIDMPGASVSNTKINQSHLNSSNLHHRGIYKFYVFKDGHIEKVEFSLIALTAIMKKQCGKLAESVRVEGRTFLGYSENKPPAYYEIHKKRQKPEYDYEVFYTGTFYPQNPEITLVHDDKETAAILAEYEAKRVSNNIKTQALREKRRAEGAALFMMMMFGAHASSDCNDPNLSAEEKHWECAPWLK